MNSWKEANETINRINDKLDLILELVNAKKDEDHKRIDEIHKKWMQ
jgi:hypothetical protein